MKKIIIVFTVLAFLFSSGCTVDSAECLITVSVDNDTRSIYENLEIRAISQNGEVQTVSLADKENSKTFVLKEGLWKLFLQTDEDTAAISEEKEITVISGIPLQVMLSGKEGGVRLQAKSLTEISSNNQATEEEEAEPIEEAAGETEPAEEQIQQKPMQFFSATSATSFQKKTPRTDE